jgi:hypothetical protein
MRRLALWPALLLLAGCSASQCDPNNAGLFTGIGCSAGSGYADRITTLQGQKSAAQAQTNQAYQSAVTAQQADAQQQQVAKVQQEIAALQAQIAAQQGQPTPGQVQELQQKQEQEKRDLLNLSSQM